MMMMMTSRRLKASIHEITLMGYSVNPKEIMTSLVMISLKDSSPVVHTVEGLVKL